MGVDAGSQILADLAIIEALEEIELQRREVRKLQTHFYGSKMARCCRLQVRQRWIGAGASSERRAALRDRGGASKDGEEEPKLKKTKGGEGDAEGTPPRPWKWNAGDGRKSPDPLWVIYSKMWEVGSSF